jgi:hypothetical protein
MLRCARKNTSGALPLREPQRVSKAAGAGRELRLARRRQPGLRLLPFLC